MGLPPSVLHRLRGGGICLPSNSLLRFLHLPCKKGGQTLQTQYTANGRKYYHVPRHRQAMQAPRGPICTLRGKEHDKLPFPKLLLLVEDIYSELRHTGEGWGLGTSVKGLRQRATVCVCSAMWKAAAERVH